MHKIFFILSIFLTAGAAHAEGGIMGDLQTLRSFVKPNFEIMWKDKFSTNNSADDLKTAQFLTEDVCVRSYLPKIAASLQSVEFREMYAAIVAKYKLEKADISLQLLGSGSSCGECDGSSGCVPVCSGWGGSWQMIVSWKRGNHSENKNFGRATYEPSGRKCIYELDGGRIDIAYLSLIELDKHLQKLFGK